MTQRNAFFSSRLLPPWATTKSEAGPARLISCSFLPPKGSQNGSGSGWTAARQIG